MIESLCADVFEPRTATEVEFSPLYHVVSTFCQYHQLTKLRSLIALTTAFLGLERKFKRFLTAFCDLELVLTVEFDGSDWRWMIIQCLDKNKVILDIKDMNEAISPGWPQQFVTFKEREKCRHKTPSDRLIKPWTTFNSFPVWPQTVKITHMYSTFNFLTFIWSYIESYTSNERAGKELLGNV